MNSYYIEVRYTLEGVRREALDQHSDAMMDALLVEPSLTDPDVGVNFGIGTVDVCVGVAAEDDPTALRIALVAIRSALHHVGPGTAGWEQLPIQLASRVRPTEMVEL